MRAPRATHGSVTSPAAGPQASHRAHICQCPSDNGPSRAVRLRPVPRRIQLRRTKGWRKPAGAVVVARPSRWGNPFAIGAPDPDTGQPMTRADAVARYRASVAGRNLTELRGKDLACWCPLDQPCHADVLLDLANR